MLWQRIFAVLLLLWMLFSDSKLDTAHDCFIIIGLILLFIGLIGRLYSTLYIGGVKNIGRDGSGFISDGIYSVCRNPLYFFSFVSLVGILLLKGQLILVAFGSIVFLVIYRVTIEGEEAFLQNKFGSAYTEFLKNTPRFFPDFSKFKPIDKLEVNIAFLHKEIKSIFAWILAALCIYIISLLQHINILPILITSY